MAQMSLKQTNFLLFLFDRTVVNMIIYQNTLRKGQAMVLYVIIPYRAKQPGQGTRHEHTTGQTSTDWRTGQKS